MRKVLLPDRTEELWAGFGLLALCAAGVANQIRIQDAPDVGTVQVTIVIRFCPS